MKSANWPALQGECGNDPVITNVMGCCQYPLDSNFRIYRDATCSAVFFVPGVVAVWT